MKGKKRCKILKEIRRQIAENNDIEFVTSECKHQGDCLGTCPKCEAEVRYLERELEKRMKLGKAVTVAGLAATITATTLLGTSCRPQIPMTERTEEFFAVQLPFVPADFANQSDEAIYTALKAALAEAQCLEEDARYVFIVHWDEDLYRSTESDGTITDTYSISSNLDKETWMVTREFLRLTFSATGTLLSASYVSQTAPQELGGDMAYVPEIYRPDNAQEFSKKELLTGMNEFLQRNKASEEDARKFIRARWNEYYAHSRDDVDYYQIEKGYRFDAFEGYVKEELTKPRYLALTFAEDGTLTAAVVTEKP